MSCKTKTIPNRKDVPPANITDGAGSEAWAYQADAQNLRSIHVNQRTTTSSPTNITKTSTYYFDLAGNLTSITYPTGRIVNYSYDAAGRPATAVDSANGITYAAAQAAPPGGCLSSGVCYTPQGAEYSAAIGKTGTFNGVNLSETYNTRLQPLEIKASSSTGNAFDITYSFVDPTSLGNAGHVYSITNNLNSSRSQSFTYDPLNRIITAGTAATSGAYCWGYLYNYDAWGNLLAQAGWSPNYNGCTEATMGSVTADGNNHISGFTYDTSGNTLNDGSIAYTYDAESQMKTAAGVAYLYDGSGRRVSKSNGKLYWYGSGGEILAETSASGATLNEYIFFGGKRVAMLPAGGNPIYYAEDLLGSSRVITQNNGAVCYDADFDPYGSEHPYTNNCPSSNAYKFEGKERDAETGNDDFGARYYTSRFGRWLSADWSSVLVPVPYANLTNPQTLNLYSMVSDDPESFADLDGHVQNASQGTSVPGEGGSGPSCAASGEGASSAPAVNGCGDQSEEASGHGGLLGLTRDWLDVIEVSVSYGLGVRVQSDSADSGEIKAGIGTETEAIVGLGGSFKTETFGGINASGKVGDVAEGEVKAGGTLSSKEGASLNAEAKGSIGSTGGGVKVDKNGITITPKSEVMKDVKIGGHGHVGLGAGMSVNLSQASRAWDRTSKSATAFLGAAAAWVQKFSLPNFPRMPNDSANN